MRAHAYLALRDRSRHCGSTESLWLHILPLSSSSVSSGCRRPYGHLRFGEPVISAAFGHWQACTLWYVDRDRLDRERASKLYNAGGPSCVEVGFSQPARSYRQVMSYFLAKGSAYLWWWRPECSYDHDLSMLLSRCVAEVLHLRPSHVCSSPSCRSNGPTLFWTDDLSSSRLASCTTSSAFRLGLPWNDSVQAFAAGPAGEYLENADLLPGHGWYHCSCKRSEPGPEVPIARCLVS